MSNDINKKYTGKHLQQEAFTPEGNPIPSTDCLWTRGEAMNYVLDKLQISKSTFYELYRDDLEVKAYGWNKKTGRLAKFRCRKSQVVRMVQSKLLGAFDPNHPSEGRS